jgi:hypothetical protein
MGKYMNGDLASMQKPKKFKRDNHSKPLIIASQCSTHGHTFSSIQSSSIIVSKSVE